MKRSIVYFLMLFLLAGCIKKEPARLLVFYSHTCPSCQAMQDSFLDQLSQLELEIELYDIDKEDNEAYYQTIIAQLENVDESLKENPVLPFIVFEKQFALVGYSSGVEELYLDLIQKGLNHEILKEELPSGCWIFKEE